MREPTGYDALVAMRYEHGLIPGLVMRCCGETPEQLASKPGGYAQGLLERMHELLDGQPSPPENTPAISALRRGPVTIPLAVPVEYQEPSGERKHLESVTLRPPTAWDVVVTAESDSMFADIARMCSGLNEGLFELMTAGDGIRIGAYIGAAINPTEPSPTP